jgi:hypothetical protein
MNERIDWERNERKRLGEENRRGREEEEEEKEEEEKYSIR